MSLPGLSPSISSVALSRLMNQWMDAIGSTTEDETSNHSHDQFVLACLLLAREDTELVRGTCLAEVNACLELARAGSWAELDEIPWLLIYSFVTTGRPDVDATRRVERMLGHDSSSIRVWFHYVAWMIHGDLNVTRVRPLLLQNLADKLGGLDESIGLLSKLHEAESVLNAAADEFAPPERFEAQYKRRLSHIRDQQWSSFAVNFWLVENKSRRLTWDAVKSMEIES